MQAPKNRAFRRVQVTMAWLSWQDLNNPSEFFVNKKSTSLCTREAENGWLILLKNRFSQGEQGVFGINNLIVIAICQQQCQFIGEYLFFDPVL